MSKVLLIGGAGYIGTVLAKHLSNNGEQVTVLDNLIYQDRTGVLPLLNEQDIQFVHGNLEEMTNKHFNNYDCIIMLAGLVGDPICKKYPLESEHYNLKEMSRFIERLSEHYQGRLIFSSTCSNYGLHDSSKLANESSELNPLSSYARAKVAIEQKIMKLNTKLPWLVLRFSTAFGLSARMRFDLTVNQFTAQAYYDKKLSVYDPDTWRPYFHTQDFANIIHTFLQREDDIWHEVYNVGVDENNYTKRMIAEYLREIIPGLEVEYLGEGCDPRNYRVSFDKLKSALGAFNYVSVPDGSQAILTALQNEVFYDFNQKNKYGNYQLDDSYRLEAVV